MTAVSGARPTVSTSRGPSVPRTMQPTSRISMAASVRWLKWSASPSILLTRRCYWPVLAPTAQPPPRRPFHPPPHGHSYRRAKVGQLLSTRTILFFGMFLPQPESAFVSAAMAVAAPPRTSRGQRQLVRPRPRLTTHSSILRGYWILASPRTCSSALAESGAVRLPVERCGHPRMQSAHCLPALRTLPAPAPIQFYAPLPPAAQQPRFPRRMEVLMSFMHEWPGLATAVAAWEDISSPRPLPTPQAVAPCGPILRYPPLQTTPPDRA